MVKLAVLADMLHKGISKDLNVSFTPQQQRFLLSVLNNEARRVSGIGERLVNKTMSVIESAIDALGKDLTAWQTDADISDQKKRK